VPEHAPKARPFFLRLRSADSGKFVAGTPPMMASAWSMRSSSTLLSVLDSAVQAAIEVIMATMAIRVQLAELMLMAAFLFAI
jgi:hypothetical protein